jgi:hypothetical protein
MENQEPLVSMYDPNVDAYRQVKLSLARKFVENVESLVKQIEEKETEIAKEKAYQESLATKMPKQE